MVLAGKFNVIMHTRLLTDVPIMRTNRRVFVHALTAASVAMLTPRTAGYASDEINDDFVFSSAMSISKAIRAKRISAEEAVKAHLSRIAAVNPQVNAVVTLTAQSAIDEARKADSELSRGELRGVLHGVPMTIKDSLDTQGVVTTAGTLGRRDFRPNRDATVVARLRKAGAILLGKTNTPELTMSYDTRNLIFGFTKNPYDLSKSPGGSSGGAAAVIASGGSPFDLGSDTGGSIRLPSGLCGIAGIKPTTGRVPLTGHIISTGLGATDPQTQVGPMARFVDDLFPLLQLISGPDDEDPATIPVALRHPGSVMLSGLRVAFHTDNGIVAAGPDVKQTVESAAATMSRLGATVEESRPEALPHLMEFIYKPEVIDGHDWLKGLLERSGTQRWDPHIDWFWESATLTSQQAGRVLRDWQRFRLEMLAWMRGFDVLLCPVYAKSSLPSGFVMEGDTLDGFTYTAAFNYTGWPAAVVRCGTSDNGMPIGVQVVSRAWREDICLAVAKHLETELGGWQKPSL